MKLEGKTKAWVSESLGEYWVRVAEYKYNSLRGDYYWVIVDVRSYKKKKDALKFASRFSNE